MNGGVPLIKRFSCGPSAHQFPFSMFGVYKPVAGTYEFRVYVAASAGSVSFDAATACNVYAIELR